MQVVDILDHIRSALDRDEVKLSIHATEEAFAEEISRQEIEEVLRQGQVLEDYPDWWLGPSCLVYGQTQGNRVLHNVCSYGKLPLVIITVYEPKPPKWISPTQRGRDT